MSIDLTNLLNKEIEIKPKSFKSPQVKKENHKRILDILKDDRLFVNSPNSDNNKEDKIINKIKKTVKTQRT